MNLTAAFQVPGRALPVGPAPMSVGTKAAGTVSATRFAAQWEGLLDTGSSPLGPKHGSANPIDAPVAEPISSEMAAAIASAAVPFAEHETRSTSALLSADPALPHGMQDSAEAAGPWPASVILEHNLPLPVIASGVPTPSQEQPAHRPRLDVALSKPSPPILEMAASLVVPATPDPAADPPFAGTAERTFSLLPITLPAFAADGFLSQPGLIETGRLDIADREWTNIIAREIARACEADGRLSIKLAPDHMGSLDISLTKTAAGWVIDLRTSSDAATQAIAADESRLFDELRQKGIILADYSLRNGVSDDGRRHQSGANAGPYLPLSDADRQSVEDQDQARSLERGRFA